MKDCMLCGAERPVSSTWVWKDGKVCGCLCAAHPLREVILSGRFLVTVEPVEEEE